MVEEPGRRFRRGGACQGREAGGTLEFAEEREHRAVPGSWAPFIDTTALRGLRFRYGVVRTTMLLTTPGTSSAIVIAFDGFPMTLLPRGFGVGAEIS